MGTFLLVVAILGVYSFVGAISFARYQIAACRSCNAGGPGMHWENPRAYHSWCGHTCAAVFLMGLFWPIGVPAAAGVLIGKSNPVDRTERRRQREIDEASHKVNLAQIRVKETEALEKALEQAS